MCVVVLFVTVMISMVLCCELLSLDVGVAVCVCACGCIGLVWLAVCCLLWCVLCVMLCVIDGDWLCGLSWYLPFVLAECVSCWGTCLVMYVVCYCVSVVRLWCVVGLVLMDAVFVCSELMWCVARWCVVLGFVLVCVGRVCRVLMCARVVCLRVCGVLMRVIWCGLAWCRGLSCGVSVDVWCVLLCGFVLDCCARRGCV